MKKFSLLLCAFAAFAIGFTSCGEPEKPNVNDIVEDGFYVVGEATAYADLQAEGVTNSIMSEGRNENDENKPRSGMYEKYIMLQGGKPFQLVLVEGSEQTTYGATLASQNLCDTEGNSVNEQPAITIQRGVMSENTTMQVEKDGMYHIVLDLNEKGDLADKTIIVAPVEWGVRGAMNGWGFTAMKASAFNKTTMTYTIENQELPAGGAFKFAYGAGWKIQLNEMPEGTAADDKGYIKTNTNLGEGCVPGAGDIKVEKGGTYTITLTYNMKAGQIKDSYAMDVKLTAESDLPNEMYMIGNADFIGPWDWAKCRTMMPVHSHPGMFWTTAYLTDTTQFKFCAVKEWSGDFTGLGTDEGYEVDGGNCKVAENGLYTIVVDVKGGRLNISKAEIYGMGPCFGGTWEERNETVKFAVAGDGTATATLTGDSDTENGVRMYVALPAVFESLWWQSEFNIYDGKIQYRADGDNQVRVEASNGQTVTLNFNKNTGSIN